MPGTQPSLSSPEGARCTRLHTHTGGYTLQGTLHFTGYTGHTVSQGTQGTQGTLQVHCTARFELTERCTLHIAQHAGHSTHSRVHCTLHGTQGTLQVTLQLASQRTLFTPQHILHTCTQSTIHIIFVYNTKVFLSSSLVCMHQNIALSIL